MIGIEPNYEYKKLNTRDISVDGLYQRDLSAPKVKKIVREFNPYLVNAIKVSFRDGKYYVFDGQHTIAAVKAKHKGADCQVDCKVFYGLTRLDEMELFILQNGASSAVATREKFRALYNNGDPEIASLVKLTEKAGLEVGFDKSQARKHTISAYYRRKVALPSVQRAHNAYGNVDDQRRKHTGILPEVQNNNACKYRSWPVLW